MSKRRRWFRSLPVLLIFGVLRSEAQSPTTSIDIKSAVDLALANNYSLKADSLNTSIAGYNTRVAKGAWLPHVNFNSKAEYNPELPSQMLPGKFRKEWEPLGLCKSPEEQRRDSFDLRQADDEIPLLGRNPNPIRIPFCLGEHPAKEFSIYLLRHSTSVISPGS